MKDFTCPECGAQMYDEDFEGKSWEYCRGGCGTKLCVRTDWYYDESVGDEVCYEGVFKW